MNTVIMWIGLVLVIALLTILNQKQIYSSTVRQACRELRELAEKERAEQSTGADVVIWDRNLSELEKHPDEFNKLDNEIGLRRAFVSYLERYYPQDQRLPALQEAAGYQKDGVWGIKAGNYGPKNK